eukprot:scaffold586586_cov114-Attheya_sp.AAC.3
MSSRPKAISALHMLSFVPPASCMSYPRKIHYCFRYHPVFHNMTDLRAKYDIQAQQIHQYNSFEASDV